MEHYDIEDSFKRQIVPWLEVEKYISPGGPWSNNGKHGCRIPIHINLYNPSPVTAHFPYIILSDIRGADIDMPSRFERGGYYFDLGGADRVIHPEVSLLIAQLRVDVEVEPLAGASCCVQIGSVLPLTVDFRYGCSNSPQRVGQFAIPPRELIEQGIPGCVIIE